jgi:hypothetical protein
MFHELKPFLHKVVNCKIVKIDKYEVNATFKNISVRCAVSRIPHKILIRLKVGDIVPIYMAKLDFDHIEGNFYSTQIPEQLLQKRMSYMSNLYLKCVKRICGEFCKIVSSRRIDRSAIREIEALLDEKINVTILTSAQLRDIKSRKVSAKSFGNKPHRKNL